MENNTKKVVVFTPHPDDHLFLAGTLLKLRDRGYEICEILFTNGETGGQLGKINVDSGELAVIRGEEFAQASVLLGTFSVVKLNYPTNKVQYDRDVFFSIIQTLRSIRPSLVFIPDLHDYHRDHKEASKISYDATKAANNEFALHLGQRFRIPVVLSYRGMSPLAHTSFYSDITSVYSRVEEIYRVYPSQMSNRFEAYLRKSASLSGWYAGCDYAEEFFIPDGFPSYMHEVFADIV